MIETELRNFKWTLRLLLGWLVLNTTFMDACLGEGADLRNV